MFSENNQEWQQVPRWVDFFIQLGFRWHSDTFVQRRIALVSMPCDSAAAGLIALGALIKDLENPKANDLDRHYDSLLQYAQQFLEKCRTCKKCQPDTKMCGYTTKAKGVLRFRGKRPFKRYSISEQTDFYGRRLFLSIPSGTWFITPVYSINFQIDGDPPPQTANIEGELTAEPYKRLIEGVIIIPENLKKSFSGLCFAGRVAGETATRQINASIRFRFKDCDYCLSDLLTINRWSNVGTISRMTFYNSRNECFDRYSSTPSIVVADGDKSFLKILSQTDFQRSDVIGVINRIMDRTDLESLGNKINELNQWYTDDLETLDKIPDVPRGIGVKLLKRRPS